MRQILQALRAAIESKNTDSLLAILSNIRLDTAEGKQAVMLACQLGSADALWHIVEQGGSVRWKSEVEDHNSWNAYRDDCPLTAAASTGVLDVVEMLVSLGADVKACGAGVLRGAVAGGNPKIIRYLLKCGADVRPYLQRLLDEGIRHNKFQMVIELISIGARVNDLELPPLLTACKANLDRTDIAKYLLMCGADVHFGGNAALKVAVEKGKAELACLLISRPRRTPGTRMNAGCAG